MSKILITGASGFVGSHLCEYLYSLQKYEITGTYLQEESFINSPVKNKINFEKLDLLETGKVYDLVTKLKPDYLVHLAASTSPHASFKNPIGTFQNNINSQLNLLEAIRENKLFETRILIISSGEIYGRIRSEDLPVNEETPLMPLSPYAVSKISQDYLALQYFLTYKIPSIRVRPFNHIGPRQGLGFIASDFSKQIAEIEKGKMEPIIKVGNLEAKRDFTDVRDVVRAYSLLLEKGLPGEPYNIGSGESYSAQTILDILLKLSQTKIAVEVDPEKLRPSDIADIKCDSTKLRDLTGWQPQIKITQTLQDTLDYWRNII